PMGGPPQGGYGGPPPPMGGPGPAGYNPQPVGGPPMGGYQPQPMPGAGMPPQQPMSPPYLASRTAARVGAPVEPFKDGIKLVLMVFGALLLAVFAVPLATDPSLVFRWDALSSDRLDALGKFNEIYFAAAGVLALVFGAVPLATVARGALTAVLGLVPVVLGLVIYLKDAKEIDWQVLVMFVMALTWVPGLLLRNEYRSQILPRLLTTVGAACVLVVMVVPSGGGDPPIVGLFQALGDAPGKAKVGVILQLLPFVLAVVSLLCWLPPPSSAGAKIVGWLVILTGVITAYVTLLVNGNLGDVIPATPNAALVAPWAAAAWAAFIGYGLATIFGKNLEHS
ncbi:MAG: hypothetical protein KJZ91_27610, partial [Myxococcales bacterium]|nr:hypothetical protein [Myxococcales bacterium]